MSFLIPIFVGFSLLFQSPQQAAHHKHHHPVVCYVGGAFRPTINLAPGCQIIIERM